VKSALAALGLLALTLGANGRANGAEFTAEADVVSVEPIVNYRSSIRRADSCIDRPNPAQGLTALLQWDLATGTCRQLDRHEAVEGYRVTYRWNGRLYEQRLDEDPGATLPVSIRVH
jgi:uncharacterized protein YcfJ